MQEQINKRKNMCRISQYWGLWLKDVQIVAKLTQMRADLQRGKVLKCQSQLR